MFITFDEHNLEVLVLSSEGNFDPQRLALESGSLLLGPMEEAGDISLLEKLRGKHLETMKPSLKQAGVGYRHR